MLGTCSACRLGVIFELGLIEQTADAILKDLIGDQETLRMVMKRQWPKEQQNASPADVPASVLRYFEQAAASLKAGHFDAAGVMFRKTLEVATREKAPTQSAKPLIKRIDKLADEGLITSDMREWAHQIRLGGNEAAHEDEPLEEGEADRLYRFTDAFLRYAYTLPAMVSRSKVSVNSG